MVKMDTLANDIKESGETVLDTKLFEEDYSSKIKVGKTDDILEGVNTIITLTEEILNKDLSAKLGKHDELLVHAACVRHT